MKSLRVAMKILLFWTPLLLTLTLIQIARVAAAPGTVVKVEPQASFAQVGETFNVNISVVDVQNLYGVEVTLYWNATVLEIINLDIRVGEPDGVLYKPVSIYKNETIKEQGKYFLAGSSTAPAPSFNGDGNVARITFNVTNIGSCRLDLEAKLADWPPPDRDPRISRPIAHDAIDGFFGRSISISVSPTTIKVGEDVSIEGFIIPARANVEVAIECYRETQEGWQTVASVKTDEQGSYLYVWRLQEEGKFEVRTTAIIDEVKVISPSVSVAVNEPQQPIWPYVVILLAVIIGLLIVAIALRRKGIKKS